MENIIAAFKKIFGILAQKIKKYLDENYLGTAVCPHCGKEENVRSFKTTKDGVRFCKECYEKLPSCTQLNFYDCRSEYITKILAYIDRVNRAYASIFCATSSYGEISLDEIHGLVRVRGMIMEAKDLDLHVLNFKPTEVTGLLQNKATGTVNAIIHMDEPAFALDECISYSATGHARLRLDGVYEYKNPPELDFFQEKLNLLVARCRESN